MIRYKKSTGGTFDYPHTLSDISLEKFLQFMQLVEPTKPQCLKNIDKATAKLANAETEKDKRDAEQEVNEAFAAITDLVTAKAVHPYYARVVSFFADGLTEAEILGKDGTDGMNVQSLTALYLHTMKVLNELPDVEYSNVIEVDKELWYLPERYMEGATVIEFAESAQFQSNAKDLAGGDWAAMAKIMCVLVRKKDEKYSQSLMKREQMFLKWNMFDVWRVAFFLSKRSEIYLLSFQSYINAQRLTKLKQELSN
jgi:hypothetical protein